MKRLRYFVTLSGAKSPFQIQAVFHREGFFVAALLRMTDRFSGMLFWQPF